MSTCENRPEPCGSAQKSQFAVVPLWVHRRIVAIHSRSLAYALYIELAGQYAGSVQGAAELADIQQIADNMQASKNSVERALTALVDCGAVLIRGSQYWLPQEDPAAFTEALAGFRRGPHSTNESAVTE